MSSDDSDSSSDDPFAFKKIYGGTSRLKITHSDFTTSVTKTDPTTDPTVPNTTAEKLVKLN